VLRVFEDFSGLEVVPLEAKYGKRVGVVNMCSTASAILLLFEDGTVELLEDPKASGQQGMSALRFARCWSYMKQLRGIKGIFSTRDSFATWDETGTVSFYFAFDAMTKDAIDEFDSILTTRTPSPLLPVDLSFRGLDGRLVYFGFRGNIKRVMSITAKKDHFILMTDTGFPRVIGSLYGLKTHEDYLLKRYAIEKENIAAMRVPPKPVPVAPVDKLNPRTTNERPDKDLDLTRPQTLSRERTQNEMPRSWWSDIERIAAASLSYLEETPLR
jgi:hypothetical protein